LRLSFFLSSRLVAFLCWSVPRLRSILFDLPSLPRFHRARIHVSSERFTVMLGSFYSLVLLFTSALAAPLAMRTESVSNVTCTDPGTTLDFHSTNVALLQICGGISGSIEFCQGNPTTTTGTSGTSQFSITPVDSGATINISKGRWEQGIKAVAAICGADKPFTATFAGGASTGDVNVELKEVSA